MRSLSEIMAIILKIWSQSALEHDLSLRCLVLDVVLLALARALPKRLSEPSLGRSRPLL
jgi:hypothetical protein